MTKTPKSYLFDIIFYAEKVEEYLGEISSLDDFVADDRSRLAIERCIEIICEASHKLKKNHQIELSLAERAYNFRGSLAHQYDEIREIKVYRFALNYVPNMMNEAKVLIENDYDSQ